MNLHTVIILDFVSEKLPTKNFDNKYFIGAIQFNRLDTSIRGGVKFKVHHVDGIYERTLKTEGTFYDAQDLFTSFNNKGIHVDEHSKIEIELNENIYSATFFVINESASKN